MWTNKLESQPLSGDEYPQCRILSWLTRCWLHLAMHRVASINHSHDTMLCVTAAITGFKTSYVLSGVLRKSGPFAATSSYSVKRVDTEYHLSHHQACLSAPPNLMGVAPALCLWYLVSFDETWGRRAAEFNSRIASSVIKCVFDDIRGIRDAIRGHRHGEIWQYCDL